MSQKNRISLYEAVSDCAAVITTVFGGAGAAALLGARIEVITEQVSETLLTQAGRGSLAIAGLSIATGIYAGRKERHHYTEAS